MNGPTFTSPQSTPKKATTPEVDADPDPLKEMARATTAVVHLTPEERAAAASMTSVPRSLASATTPALAGFLLTKSDIGWPLVIAGAGKATYDLLLLALFRSVVPEGEDRAGLDTSSPEPRP